MSNDGETLTGVSNCYVNSSYIGEKEYGTEDEPYKNLYKALNAAGRKDGDVIHIAGGEYVGEGNIGLFIEHNLTFTHWGDGEVVNSGYNLANGICWDIVVG